MDVSRRSAVRAGLSGFAAIAALGALAAGLRPDTFYVGDPGVKLIAARHARAHPGSPLEIPLPVLGGERVPYVEPFFAIHGDHTHPVTAEVFPLLSAPLIALFGIRGAYILPALGFLLTLGASASIACTLDRRRSAAVVALTALLGTPFLFYGLEFWEHMPAVGVATLATALLINCSTSFRARRGRAFLIGILYGLAILLRPEALAFVLAAAVASRLLPSPPRAATLAIAAAGLLVAVLPLEIYFIAHFHSVVPPHIAAHEVLLGSGWIAKRAAIVSTWLVPRGAGIAGWWGAALLACFTVALFVPASRRAGASFLIALGIIDIALVVATAPNDGGSQWGPRYLLFAFVPAAIVLADALHAASRHRIAGVTLSVLLVAAGLWTQRGGYRQLRGTKNIYGRVLDFVRREVPPQGTAVTDVWWLDQVAAAATDERRILFISDRETGRDAMSRLDKAGAPELTVIRSREDDVPWVDELATSCYVESGIQEIPERGLVAVHLTRLSSSAPPPCAKVTGGSTSEPPQRP